MGLSRPELFCSGRVGETRTAAGNHENRFVSACVRALEGVPLLLYSSSPSVRSVYCVFERACSGHELLRGGTVRDKGAAALGLALGHGTLHCCCGVTILDVGGSFIVFARGLAMVLVICD